MTLTSFAFIGFVLAALAIYHLVPPAWKKYILLIASLVFYAAFSWQSLIVFSLIALANFLVGIQLSREKNNILWLWLGILTNIVSLIIFKYADFYLPQVEAVLQKANIQTSTEGLKILLPIGLTFFVTQGISYLLDISKKRVSAIKYFPDFWLFALYFPKLLSGPMERAGRFIKQINQPQIVDTKTLETSLALIVVGTVRKMVLADPLTSMLPSDVFTAPQKFAPHLLAAWLLAYGFAIYNDFAGYTNIIRGVSGLFGISLTQNFNVPYFARDFTEFWQRWHISFSNWLRDYIFFPLTRFLRRKFDRKNPLNVILPPMTTMIVSGLWHGLNPHMIVWGGLHGLYQVIERIPSLWRPTIPPAKRPKWRQ
ncbi:MAG: MBOAT family O-acyltransferase, partial [Chloroflexota bacterium]|nr:MBOAT family O-acyltransferase [Chloroflexota bacterium]